jgi:hypothetical protein
MVATNEEAREKAHACDPGGHQGQHPRYTCFNGQV